LHINFVLHILDRETHKYQYTSIYAASYTLFTDAAAVVVIGLHVTQLYDANCYYCPLDRQYWIGTELPISLC